jgi:hypothetical protein
LPTDIYAFHFTNIVAKLTSFISSLIKISFPFHQYRRET